MTKPAVARALVVLRLITVALLAGACSAGAASATPTAAGTPTASATSTPTEAPTSAAAVATATPNPPGGGRYGGGSSSPSAAAGVVVSVGQTSVGSVLVGPTRNTLYTLAGDSTKHSTCTGGCLSAWPPLLVTAGGAVSAGTGVPGKLSTFTRSDGTVQVAYNGHPLYFYAGDSPGAVDGQGMGGFTVARP